MHEYLLCLKVDSGVSPARVYECVAMEMQPKGDNLCIHVIYMYSCVNVGLYSLNECMILLLAGYY